jgi:hypothetical protein
MRTTLALDEDVAVMIKQLQKKEEKPFKQIVNELLRIGLAQKKAPVKPKKEYSTPELHTGPSRYADLDNIGEILAVAETEDYT